MDGRNAKPIDSYAVIGNMRTAALVCRDDASIDFMCHPFFDSPSLFCRLLDPNKGHFSIHPVDLFRSTSKQFYYPLSNVLVTRFTNEEGIGRIVDLMPVGKPCTDPETLPTIIRKVEVIRGRMQFVIDYNPQGHYGRSIETQFALQVAESTHDICDSPKLPGEISLCESTSIIFYMSDRKHDYSELVSMIEDTNEFWRTWVRKCTYRGRWREIVLRSALALKLLTFAPTGAILAAPTFSLPARIGGSENWDYRFAWVRDSAFTLYAFIRIGIVDEARAFMDWIETILREAHEIGEPSIRIMYGIHVKEGQDLHSKFDEVFLDDFEGYKSSRPVRIGNAAAYQTQLDIYGEIMDSLYLCDKYFSPISYDLWKSIKALLIEPVLKGWTSPDHGIWELRGPPQHNVYSKLMCWVALDRAIRLSLKHSLPAETERWRQVRDEIRENIMQEGWSDDLQSFTQSYGSRNLDAANLIMPLVFFISPTDPRMIKTIEATARPPSQGGLTINNMVYRFPSHEGTTNESTFSMCSFWLVEAMARAGRSDPVMLKRALEMFEELLGYANHVGLYSEGIDMAGQATGNFPQAFTHFSLISAAYCLDKALG